MPSPSVLDGEEVLKVFRNLEVELRRLIRKQLRGADRVRGGWIADAIVALVRSRWDNARSLHSWWEDQRGKDQLRADNISIGLNSLYDQLAELGVDVRGLLVAIARGYNWLYRPLFIIDDTSRQKYGARMEGVSSVHVANVKGTVMGHTVVTLMASTIGGALFLDHYVKMNGKRPRAARRPGRLREIVQAARDGTKHEMALDMINRALEH